MKSCLIGVRVNYSEEETDPEELVGVLELMLEHFQGIPKLLDDFGCPTFLSPKLLEGPTTDEPESNSTAGTLDGARPTQGGKDTVSVPGYSRMFCCLKRKRPKPAWPATRVPVWVDGCFGVLCYFFPALTARKEPASCLEKPLGHSGGFLPRLSSRRKVESPAQSRERMC